MSLITPTNGNAAVIIGNRQHDHEFVIIAVFFELQAKRRQFSATMWFSGQPGRTVSLQYKSHRRPV